MFSNTFPPLGYEYYQFPILSNPLQPFTSNIQPTDSSSSSGTSSNRTTPQLSNSPFPQFPSGNQNETFPGFQFSFNMDFNQTIPMPFQSMVQNYFSSNLPINTESVLPKEKKRENNKTEVSQKVQKRKRTAFNELQLEKLEEEFKKNKRVFGKKSEELSKELELSETVIQVWFKNRRAKERIQAQLKPTKRSLIE